MLELVARVCAKLPVQLVLTRGNWMREEDGKGGGGGQLCRRPSDS